ncbi:nucleosome binding protein [Chrysochromulina tobinii]|uniref:Nucleosome binding protein n=1 Tax=Chrysochromulina tobinii TaxID=1460289 RepID=A0A0M0JS79_9EUKA|nr:nucleosome binding protein [Chrysochromulina tobinii]|eukprot:KOO29370.1 nucleosome binding protein [Chrysochromulina sp. CCMP291]
MPPKKTGGVEKKEPKAGGKKPVTGFMKFSAERRPTLKAEQPDLTFGGIGKALGAEWRGMSDKEKEKYK